MAWHSVNKELPPPRTFVLGCGYDNYFVNEGEPVEYRGVVLFSRVGDDDLFSDELRRAVAMQDKMWMDANSGGFVNITKWHEWPEMEGK